MENIKAFYIDTFPLKEAVKKDDLIFYDLPILSRYVLDEKNYLFYHIDDENNIDTYLVFEISEYNLFKLTSGNSSLLETILRVNNFVYIIDKDINGNVIKTAYLHSSSIIEDYLPEEDSFLKTDFVKDSYYYNLNKKYKEDYYTERLRENAFYLKIAPEPHNKKYGETLGFEEMVDDILPKITDSYKKYTKSDFENNFKTKITDTKTLNSTYNKVYKLVDYRIVDLKYGSFEIGIASDKIMTATIEQIEIKEWANSIGENFKNDVLEIDLNNKDEFNRITAKFNEEQRNKIYTPIINLANDKNIVFSIKDNKFSKYKNIKKPKQETLKKFIPKKLTIPELNDKELDLIQFTGVVEKGKKISAINYGLFNSLNETHLYLTNETFLKYNIDIDLKKQIPVSLTKKDGKIEISASYNEEKFTTTLDNANLDSAIEKLTNRIYEYYLNINSD